MKVHELMNPNVETCRAEDDLSAAAMVMWRRDCGFVPVVDPSSEKVVGVITDRDICMAAATRHIAPESLRVRDVMATDVCACEAEDNVDGALRTMRSRQVHRLPVVDRGGRLRGVLSIADVTRAAPNDAVAHRDLVETYREIHRPRTPPDDARRADPRSEDRAGRHEEARAEARR
jgi:CBS domain-containing protein